MNWQNYFASNANPYNLKWLAPVIVLVIIWTLVWKGLALWRAARNGDAVWFVVLLVVNTLGVLEILYLFVFGKPKSPPLQ
jgi:hypothetical protein